MFQNAFDNFITKSLDDSDSTEHRIYKVGKFVLTLVLCVLVSFRINTVTISPNETDKIWSVICSPVNIITILLVYHLIAQWLLPLYVSILLSFAHYISNILRKVFTNFPKPVHFNERKPFTLDGAPFIVRKLIERLINVDVIRIKDNKIAAGAFLPKLEHLMRNTAEGEDSLPVNEFKDKLLFNTLAIVVIYIVQSMAPINGWVYKLSLILMLLNLFNFALKFITLKILDWNISRIADWVDSFKSCGAEAYKEFIVIDSNRFYNATSTSDQIPDEIELGANP